MSSSAYALHPETEPSEGPDGVQTQRRRKIVIISVMCCVVVLLLGGLAGGVWYYDKSVEKGAFERTRTRTNALSGGSVFVAAGTSKTTFGLSQTGASGQSRSQTSAAGPASENGGGSMKAVQVEDGSFLGRARLFYANNRRAVLIAVVVSVVVVIAIVATVTTVMLLQRQQQAVSQVTTNDQHTDNLEPHPEATHSVNVPLAVGLSVGIFVVLSAISIAHMFFCGHFKFKGALQFVTHFLIHTIFLSPMFVFYYMAKGVEKAHDCLGLPIFLRIPPMALLFVLSLPFIALGGIGIVLVKCILDNVVASNFEDFADDYIIIVWDKVKGLFTG